MFRRKRREEAAGQAGYYTGNGYASGYGYGYPPVPYPQPYPGYYGQPHPPSPYAYPPPVPPPPPYQAPPAADTGSRPAQALLPPAAYPAAPPATEPAAEPGGPPHAEPAEEGASTPPAPQAPAREPVERREEGAGSEAEEEHHGLLPKALANLAMRDLTLVESLLVLIQQLERQEEDPKLLEILYQIDHIGTRMRRNSENLLVMAEEPVPPSHREPVLLYDVVRAATSEITHFTRVRIQELPNVFVQERVADDLSHVLAELMENSIAGSPQEQPVTVRGRCNDAGTVVLEVADDGIGLPEEKLDRINAELRQPPRLTPEKIRHMGLFVAGLLAHRHGMNIRLQTRPFSGTSGFVRVPAALVTLAQQEGPRSEQRAPAASAAARPTPPAEVPEPVKADPPGGRPGELPPLPKREPGRGPGGLRVVSDENTQGPRGEAVHAFTASAEHETAGEGSASEPLPELPRRNPAASPSPEPPAEEESIPVRGRRPNPAEAAPPSDPHSYAERVRDDLSGFLAGQRKHQEESRQQERTEEVSAEKPETVDTTPPDEEDGTEAGEDVSEGSAAKES